MPCTASQTLRQSGATTVLRPRAEARTPFGTPFFKLAIDPDTDTGTFVKRRLDTGMREEIRAWEKLQQIGDDSDLVDAPTAEEAIGGGFVVGGKGYPTYFVPDVDGPGDPEASTDSNYDERLWPDTYTIGSDSDIDYVLDGFVVIDMADATGSVFWNHRRGCRHKRVSEPLVALPWPTSPYGTGDALVGGGRLGDASGGMATYHELNRSVVGFGRTWTSEHRECDIGGLGQGLEGQDRDSDIGLGSAEAFCIVYVVSTPGLDIRVLQTVTRS
ncbi:hypothetical protein V8D89_005729 [Ganoderma adspersum]